MRPFLFVIALVAVVSARPEPPSGYSYSAPAAQAAPSSQYGAPSAFSGSVQGPSSFPAGGFGGHSSAGGFSGHSAQGASFGGHSAGFGGGFGASAGGADVGAQGFGGAGPATVHKHIYVHVAPEEPEEFRAQRPVHVPAPQKHYKIIFIKAPTAPTPTAPVIPAQPQNEEKTLVYVLVKKPEEQPDVVIPTAAPTQPSKPEVYFIKYNTRKESAAAGGAGFGGTGAGQDHIAAGDLDTVSVEANSARGASGFGAEGHAASAGVSAKYGPPGYQH